MLILLDAIRTIENGGFVFFLKKGQKLVSFQKKQKNEFKENQEGCLKKKRFFLDPEYLSILFCDFPLIARSGTRHVTISLIGVAPHT